MSRFKYHKQYTLIDGSIPPLGYPTARRGIIDSHFHLDKFSGRQNHFIVRSGEFKISPDTCPVCYSKLCFSFQMTSSPRTCVADPRLRITLGVHPHMITYP